MLDPKAGSHSTDPVAWLNKAIPIRALVSVSSGRLKRWDGGEWRGDCGLCGQGGALFVHPRRNLWVCNNGCGEHSTPVEWVMKDLGCDQEAAIAYLGKLAEALSLTPSAGMPIFSRSAPTKAKR